MRGRGGAGNTIIYIMNFVAFFMASTMDIHKRHANNNVYERFNGTVKDRIKCVRGFRSELPALHMLFLAYYNLFRPHSGMGERSPPRRWV